jgi:diguanylate cyclase (GGDEF)-like protein/PAS domain S-box-containing protein
MSRHKRPGAEPAGTTPPGGAEEPNGAASDAEEPAGEISMVIRALRAADLRLQELTAGEVDSVSDRDGRAYLLQPAQDRWRESEAAKHRADAEALLRFASAMDASSDAIYLVDRLSMRFIYANEAAWRSQAQTRAGLLALPPAQVFDVPPAALEQTYDTLIAGDVEMEPEEVPGRGRDGARTWTELRRHAQRTGERWTIVTMVRDITARKDAETRILRLNRVHAVLSSINTLIVRVRSREELFTESCRIAAEQGGFPKIWIGMVDRAAMKIVPVAAVGISAGYLEFVREKLSLQAGAPFGNTLTARAVRERRALWANDLEIDTDVVFHSQLVTVGIRSMAVLPLLIAEEVVGMVALYAEETEFFHADELKLLTELTGDIAFAIDHIDKQERLDYIAYYDVLTGLANRGLFLERTEQYIRSAGIGQRRLALFLIDLERFKNINGSLGRPAGDALLRQVAQWLIGHVGDANLLARVGPDHFGMLLPDIQRVEEVARVLEDTLHTFLGHEFLVAEVVLRISAKMGVAVYPEDGADADTLFKNAESALKGAKRSGARYLCYAEEMTASMAERLSLESRLRQALERSEFVLHYQPKVNMVSQELTGVEALLRWQDPLTGMVPPNRFIPILEETGLIHEVGQWALREAVAIYRRWREASLRPVRIAVNVSPVQLRNRGFVAEIQQVLGADAAAAAGLELEITESIIMEDVRFSIASLRAIRALGVGIAIDDFGTGFSSLSHLARLPVHTLKIDRSFIIDMTVSPEGLALVSTIIHLAHSLKLNVVAEGVETQEQSRLLRVLNCDEMQGYLISKPLPRDIFEAKYLRLRSVGGATGASHT